jgi:hypothetical protein
MNFSIAFFKKLFFEDRLSAFEKMVTITDYVFDL